MNNLQLYLRLIRFSLRSQLAYRTSFILQTLGQFVVTWMEFVAVWALLNRFGHIKGWTLAEVCFFYGTVNATFAIADAISRGFDQFGNMVRSGEFDRLLLRPRSTVLQLLGQELTLRRAGRFIQAMVVLGIGVAALPHTATASNVALFTWTVATGVCLFLGILIIQATICFWTVESIEMMNVLTYGGVFTAQYPITIYQDWLQKLFFYVVPLACVAYIPVLGLLGKNQQMGYGILHIWLAPLAGPLFLLVALRIWDFGVRRYCSTGS
ncbi:MAG: ABC transporter permease, partial [Candidatus Methylacidiphilales bacterium]|nr:ABC-2 family transporter protein [Candidatus Methylacidiphilales bacterium]